MRLQKALMLLFLVLGLLSCKKKDNDPVPVPSPSKTIISNFALEAKYIGDADFEIPTPSSNNPSQFIYSSDNPTIASIKGNTIQIKKVGKVTITVTQKGSKEYEPGSAKTNFTILPNVYITGYSYSPDGYLPVYWKNGVINNLEEHAIATDIFIQNKDVYVSGSFDGGIFNNPGYWKNGKKHLITTNLGETSGIAVSGNDVYVVGLLINPNPNDYVVRVVWKNDKVITLQNPLNCCGNSSKAIPTGITLHNNKVYICGIVGEDELGSPIIWNGDGSVYQLFDEKTAISINQIAFSNDDIYLSGALRTDKDYLTFWKNGKPNSIENTTRNTLAYNSIAVNGNDVYTAGIDVSDGIPTATYWKNGVKTVLSKDASAYRIATNGSDVYIVGQSYNGYSSYYDYYAVYWLNGQKINLEAPKGTAATSIKIVEF